MMSYLCLRVLAPVITYFNRSNAGYKVPVWPLSFLVTPCEIRTTAPNVQIFESSKASYGLGQALKSRATIDIKTTEFGELSHPLRQHGHCSTIIQGELFKGGQVLNHVRQLVQIVPTTNGKLHQGRKVLH